MAEPTTQRQTQDAPEELPQAEQPAGAAAEEPGPERPRKGLDEKQGQENPLEQAGIFLDAQTINIIHAGHISDSTLQGSGGERRKDGALQAVPPPGTEAEFEQYFSRFSASPAFFSLLAAASLEVVEESRLDELSDDLRRTLLPPPAGDGADEERSQDAPISHSALLRLAFLERCTVRKQTNIGALELCAVQVAPKGLGDRVRRWFWSLYPQFREKLVQWLLGQALTGGYPTDAQARKALAHYAALDFGYTYEQILPKLTHRAGLGKISSLTLIIQRLAADARHEEAVARQLRAWLSVRGSRLWMIPLQLYALEEGRTSGEEITAFLDRLFAGDVYPPESAQTWEAEQYLMGLAQRSLPLRRRLTDALALRFNRQRDHRGRSAAASVFLELLQADYFMESQTYPRLQLLDALNEPEAGKALAPLLRFVWQRNAFRQTFQQVLQFYLREHGEDQVPLAYLRSCFYRLAFTGTEADYDQTLDFLMKLDRLAGTGKVRDFARETAHWLADLLNRHSRPMTRRQETRHENL